MSNSGTGHCALCLNYAPKSPKRKHGGNALKLNTRLINKALKIAYDAHHGQLDKTGAPYIFHPA